MVTLFLLMSMHPLPAASVEVQDSTSYSTCTKNILVIRSAVKYKWHPWKREALIVSSLT
jgi:hypothetical protein